MADVIMPKMGDAMTEGKVLKWKKHPGDRVAKGDPIAEIETDKVNVDIEADEAGVLLEVLAEEGQTVPVGSSIAVIGAPGQKVEPRAPRPAPAPQAGAAPAPSAAGGVKTGRPEEPAAPDTDRIKASPLARKLAAERGIDLAAVRGSGPEGRITKEDIEALIAAAADRPAAGAPPAGPAQVVERPGPAAPATETVPLTRIRQTIGRRMTDSKQQAPHFYVSVEVLMDEALRARQQLNAVLGEARKVSVNDFIIKASALALRTYPNLNSALVEGSIRRFRRINVAIAIALPDGLIAPVIHDCDRLTIPEIGTKAKDLGERARSGRLRPEDYEGATFTITNLGMFDVENFIAIINPPHAAILATGTAKPRPVARDGAVAVAATMHATLSADHRVTDGAEVAQFLAALKRLLENPLLLFLPGER